MNTALRVAGLCAGALCLGLGCMPEFEEAWRVKDLRILGMRVEPAELQLPIDPAHPPLVTVDALVVDPSAPPQRPYTWELWICTPEGGLCDAAKTKQLLHRGRTSLNKISHGLVLSTEALQGQWARQDSRFPLKLELRVFQEQGPTVRGVKRLFLSPKLEESKAAVNPKLKEVRFEGQAITGPISVSCQAPPRRLELTILTELNPVSTYLDAYTSRGDFVGPQGSDAFGFRVTWSPCAAGGPGESLPGTTGYLWLVLRDSFGGIDWQTVQVDRQ